MLEAKDAQIKKKKVKNLNEGITIWNFEVDISDSD